MGQSIKLITAKSPWQLTHYYFKLCILKNSSLSEVPGNTSPIYFQIVDYQNFYFYKSS
jgi:hypothetical protein